MTILLNDLDTMKLTRNNETAVYYCANILNKTCSTKLLFIPKGGSGCNYRYCASCYKKWDIRKDDIKAKKYINDDDIFYDSD